MRRMAPLRIYLGFETNAIILDDDAKVIGAAIQQHANGPGIGVLEDVGQGLLDRPINHDFDFGG